MKFWTFAVFALVLCLFVPSAFGAVIVDNLSTLGDLAGATIDYGWWVADSFSSPEPAVVTGVEIIVWEYPGDTTTQLDWSIGTSPNDNSVGYGPATGVTDQFLYGNGRGYNVDELSFTLGSGVSLAAATPYYLTIQNDTGTNPDFVYWDINNAPGIDVWDTGTELSAPGQCSSWTYGYASGTCANTFEILDSTSDAPEPATLTLIGSGLLAAFLVRRKACRMPNRCFISRS